MNQAYDKELKQLQESVERRRPLTAQVELTCAFLGGYQWLTSSIENGLLPVENPANKIRITDNRMLPAYNLAMHFHLQEKPVIVAHEGAREVKDARRARVASALLEYCETQCGLAEAREEGASWSLTAGASFLAPIWKPEKNVVKRKRPVRLETPVTRNGKKSYLGVEEYDHARGDIAFEVYNPLQVHTFPGTATTWQKVRKIHIADMVTREDAEDAYPEAGLGEMKKARAEDYNLKAIDQANNFVSNMIGSMADPRTEERYLRLQVFERPSRRHPNGRMRVFVGGVLCQDTDLPFVDEAREVDPNDVKNMSMGIVPWFGMKFPGRLIPPSMLAELIPYQTQINDLKTDQARNRKTVGVNKVVMQKGVISKDEWTNEHGELIEVDGDENIKPQFIQAPTLMGIDGEIAQAENSFDEATGQLPILKGHNAPNVRSPFHFEVIRNEAMRRIHASIAQMEKAYNLAGTLILAILKRRYTPDRVLEIYGQDYAGDALGWKGMEIRTDVRIQSGSMIPKNKALYEQKLTELLQYGAFGDNLEQFWDMTELGTMNRAVDADHMVKLMARRENASMLGGKVEIPIEREPHDIHIEEHDKFMASSLDYKLAPDSVKMVFEAHREMHVDMRREQLAPTEDDPIPNLGMGAGGGLVPGGMPAAGGLPSGQPPAAMPVAATA